MLLDRRDGKRLRWRLWITAMANLVPRFPSCSSPGEKEKPWKRVCTIALIWRDDRGDRDLLIETTELFHNTKCLGRSFQSFTTIFFLVLFKQFRERNHRKHFFFYIRLFQRQLYVDIHRIFQLKHAYIQTYPLFKHDMV